MHTPRGIIPYFNIFSGKIEGILDAVTGLSDAYDESWFSDPNNFAEIPFLSTAYKPRTRINLLSSNTFRYMGRKRFKAIYEAIDSLIKESAVSSRKSKSLTLYGSAGSGKSYILAALACLLVKRGKNVVYIPNCEALVVGNPTALFKEILSLTFYPAFQKEISAIHNIAGFEGFLAGFDDGDIICIADDLHELYTKPHDDSAERSQYKALANVIMHIFSSKHVLVFSATKAFIDTQVDLKNQKAEGSRFFINGMTKVCFRTPDI